MIDVQKDSNMEKTGDEVQSISAADLGVNIPQIPNRKERRRRAKDAGIFKHKGGFRHVSNAANMQRQNAINKAIDLANKKFQDEEEES